MYDVIIIGGGPAGMAVALNTLRNGRTCLLLEKENFGGQMATSPKLENIPGIKAIAGVEYTEQMFDQITDMGADFELEEVESITKEDEKFIVKTNYNTYESWTVVLANGCHHRKMNLPHEDDLVGKGVSYCAVCDGAFYKGQTTNIIGDANTALQYALLLSNYIKKITVYNDNEIRIEVKDIILLGFSGLIIIFSDLFQKTWMQKEKLFCYIWGMENVLDNEPNNDFISDQSIDFLFGTKIKVMKKRKFILRNIISYIILGIVIIILDMWNDVTAKILLTTVTIFGFSIPTLCCSNLYEKKSNHWFAILGMIICILSGIYVLSLIWELINPDFGEALKGILTAIVISTSLGHLSLMMLVSNSDSTVNGVKNATIIVSVLLDCMIILSLWVEDNMFSWQFYAIVGILVALGTIVTPILNKVRKSEEVKSVSQINMEEQKEKISLNTIEDDLKLLSYFKDKGYILDEEFEIISSRITKKDS